MIKGIFWLIVMLTGSAYLGGFIFSNSSKDPVIGGLTLSIIILAQLVGALFVAALWRVQS